MDDPPNATIVAFGGNPVAPVGVGRHADAVDLAADPARLFVLHGLPGSGKTTAARALADAYRAVTMSADDVLALAAIDRWDAGARATVEAHQQAQIGALLRSGRSVVVEWGSWSRAERDELLAIGRAAGARVELHTFDAPLAELHRRTAARGHETPAMTSAQFEEWAAVIDRPDAAELATYDNARPLRAATLVDHFDGETAEAYDELQIADSAVDDAVAVLAEFAHAVPVWGRNRVLEFAIGTGRIARPLAATGVDVVGIDTSAAMLAQLAAKPDPAPPGTEPIRARQGEMATTYLGESFGLVFLVFNTIMNLTTQVEQRSCFANAAAHLAPGGRFVVEVIVPDLSQRSAGTNARVFHIEDGYVGIDEITDPVDQQLTSHHYWHDERSHHSSTPFRFVWPAELDLMAELAGLRLEHRWADWDRSPFTAESPFHVSVWCRPAPESQ